MSGFSQKKLSQFPWNQLHKIGDHFFVPREEARFMPVYSHRQSQIDGRKYLTRSMQDGYLVILIAGPGLEPQLKYYGNYPICTASDEIPF